MLARMMTIANPRFSRLTPLQHRQLQRCGAKPCACGAKESSNRVPRSLRFRCGSRSAPSPVRRKGLPNVSVP
jgi:hypothetical protein